MLTYLVMLILAVNVTAVEKVSSMRVAGREVAPIGVMDKAAIPREINFQGYLTDADADTALSGNYDMVFKIYDALTGGNVLWNESWTDVSVDGGIFNVILGETQPIPDSVFLYYTGLWLELLIEGETLTPRQKIVSVGRAYKAARADTANYAANAGASSTSAYADSSGISAYSWDGLHATRADTANFALDANVQFVDSARVSANSWKWANNPWGTEVPTANIADTANYVAGANVVGEVAQANHADTADYALAANVVSVDSATYADTANYAINAGTASTAAYADSAGVTPYAHEAGHATYADTAQYTIGGGSTAYADSAGIAANAHKLQGKDTTAFAPTVHNHIGEVWEANSGTYALRKKIDVNSSSHIYTQVDSAINSGSGNVYGGMFYASGSAGGSKYGLSARADAPSTPTSHTYGVSGFVDNSSSGQAIGGYFYGGGSGSGIKYGVQSNAYASSASTNPVYGVSGYATHMGSEPAYGGYFYTSTNGTGPHYGVYSESDSFGIYAKSTSGTGNYAGYFDGNVKVASNITSDDLYRGAVTADSALMTKKYIDQQTTTAANTGYHAPTLTVSMSPDSTGDWVCDGTSDDVEIQAALDQINTLGGGVVYVKQGTYNLSGNLTPYSNTTLMGTGPGTVLNRTTATAINVNNKTRVVIENLRLTGSATYGIYFYNTTDSEIKQCWIENSGTYGIRLDGSGGVNNSHYNVIANNICNCSGSYCIYVKGYENIIQGNNCRNATSSCIYLNAAESNVVVGNVVDGGTSGAGIKLSSNSMDNTITGNTLIKGKLYLSNSTWNTVSSNTVFQHTIYLHDSDWNTVVGNTVRGGVGGVHLSSGSDFNTISNNICYNHSSKGIYLTASDNNTVTDNVCADNGVDGITLTNNSDYNVVNDNRCINNTSYGIGITSATCNENVIQNNMLKGNTGGSYIDYGTNTRDDDAGGGGRCTQGTANFE